MTLRRCPGWLLVLATLSMASMAGAAELSGSLQQRIRAGTFEVVQLKPADGAVVFERPLPLEMLPYQERTDQYRSIGTAFAVGHNRYVTAAHVLQLGNGSQFGPPALRDSAGKVYALDQIVKYSDHEDFAVFSLASEPKGVQPLATGPHPGANDTVFAVGNALGQGVVIRDGVFTSDTPEELNGEWRWLRFSAAASPGNSGGPLLDAHGRVIGIVLRKSQAENLNYALPIERVSAAQEGVGRLRGRSPIRVPLMDATETLDVDEHFKLPLDLPQFFHTVTALSIAQVEHAQELLLEHKAAQLFPNGDQSNQLLHQAYLSPLPRLIRQQTDGVWRESGGEPKQFQLDANGFVRIDGNRIRLRAPDDVPLASLYSDSKLLMDQLLKGLAIHRQVGSESVKVISLGAGRDLGNFTDHYGRVWQLRSWPVPFADLLLIAMCLPTPEGYALQLMPIATGMQDVAVWEQEQLSDYLYVSLTGRLQRWHEFLEQQIVRPQLFSTLSIEIDPDHRLNLRSPRFELEVSPELVKLSDDTVLSLLTSFYRDRGQVVWDIAGVSVEESAQRSNSVNIERVGAPEPSLPEGFQSNWAKVQARDYPYNSTVIIDKGHTSVRTVASAGGAPAGTARYTLEVISEGTQPQDMMSQRLDRLQSSFKALER